MAQVKVNSIKRVAKLYVEHDGKDIEVKQISSPEGYGKDVTIFTKEAVKGKTKGTTLYAVSVKDYIPRRGQGRKSVSDKIASLKAEGLTAEQILAQLA